MKKIIILAGFALVVSGSTYAQGTSVKTDLPHGWQLLDKSKDGVYGLSMDKAYEFVKGKKSTTIVVAVIDAGIDTLHEDLKDILWVNPKEIPGNGIDDDHNGYVDDVHGWNFIGGKDGRYVKEDSYEAIRVYYQFKDKYENKPIDVTKFSQEQKDEYEMWLKAKEKVVGDATGGVDTKMLQKVLEMSVKNDSILKKSIGKDVYSGNDLDSFAAVTPDAARAKAGFLYLLKANNMMESTNKEFIDGLSEYVTSEERKKDGASNPPKPYRAEIVKDNEMDFNDKFYGNADVMSGNPFHGTHVAGIIAAKRNNGLGMDGVADNVKIMAIRAVPDGDEHDKDIALAIRYAVDNGARVVNMSFGKSFSPEKKWVDEAVKYAESKGVLLVHAAGNDAANVDSVDNFPNPYLRASGTRATNWITVGASSELSAESFKSYTASFSNYGKSTVDVFAPGTKIYSTIPGGNTYGNAQGTSMASPVVAGLAAFILSYYPELTPQQVKMVIEKSVVKLPEQVKKPGSDDMVNMSDLCTSGGIVNGYEAIKLASTLKLEGKKAPKSSLKKGKKD
ncbi:S8 family peptidase [Pinibacter soli]|uniref:S8 family peptidase n=1 Tax=Pinibacter soli TaxID=3044211 RepID=A0ABT6RG59_9BACT|nr:S8 family peptidase [Pinibacter soli]MDI3321547.1 S8 family peptidase [Pinibacter soli]